MPPPPTKRLRGCILQQRVLTDSPQSDLHVHAWHILLFSVVGGGQWGGGGAGRAAQDHSRQAFHQGYHLFFLLFLRNKIMTIMEYTYTKSFLTETSTKS